MKYYIIAGEASGDLHASNLMKELKKNDPSAEFRCWGGDLMQQQGAVLVKHYRELAFMGFAEVLANLKTILSNIPLPEMRNGVDRPVIGQVFVGGDRNGTDGRGIADYLCRHIVDVTGEESRIHRLLDLLKIQLDLGEGVQALTATAGAEC